MARKMKLGDSDTNREVSMNTQHNSDNSRSLSRGASKSAFGVGALVLVAGLGWRAVGNAQSTTEKASASAKSPAKTATSGASEYRPSEFAGVQVRSRPEAAAQSAGGSAKRNSGLIYVKPGTALPPASSIGPFTHGTAGKRVVAGRSRVGGKALYLPESSLPFASAKVARSGRVVLKCDRNGKPHSAAAHAKHARHR